MPERLEVDSSKIWLMWRTVEAAMHQVGSVAPALRGAVDEAAATVTSLMMERPSSPLPDAPTPGAVSETVFVVGTENLASSMGHPDPDLRVLGTPAISLWFEISTNPLMPPASSGARHVGVGILTHHVGRASLDEEVVVRAEVVAVRGRTVMFACDARVQERVVALGTHQRVMLPQDAIGAGS